ncbi:hypothetical protein [Saccharicrinis aurantiacus]|uniref:hypothetical protein n=1 Tax=Saccharicrinis aurantiacus TaxID=1849719 RepID=UPI0024908D78|nr:hypothetical protein [Saccharicrinis aurantiacus]
MKKLLITSWTLLFIALVFIVMHYPGSALILMLGTLLLLTHSILHIIKNWRVNLSCSLSYLTFSIWTTYISFRLLYWPCGPDLLGFSLLFLIGCLISFIWVRTYFINRQKFNLSQFILVSYICLAITISFIHSDEIYYYRNIKTIEYPGSEYDYYDCIIWDKYSWFLYCAGKYEQAVFANIEAQKAALHLNQKSMLGSINYHCTLIESKTWKDYNQRENNSR